MTDFREAVIVRSGDQRTDLLNGSIPKLAPEEISRHRPWFDGRRLTSVRETISDDARTRRRYPGRSGFRSEPLCQTRAAADADGAKKLDSPRVHQEGLTEAGQRSGGPR